jgi:hypothetical protein
LEFRGIGGIIRETDDGVDMIEKKRIGRFSGLCLTIIYATLVTGLVYGLWRLHIALVLLLFATVWIGFYFTGVRTAIERPTEVKKKFPRGYPDRRGMGAESDVIAEQFVPSEHYKAQQRAMAQTLNAAGLSPEQIANMLSVPGDDPKV